jgi:hydrogenase maturation protease
MATLVVGLGNPILGDDGLGWRVAEEVSRQMSSERSQDGSSERGTPGVDIDCLSLGGLSLMEHLAGYEKVIIIDAIHSGQYPHGSVHVFRLDELPNLMEGHTSSAHDTSLQTAIEVGRLMGVEMPEEITVVAVESPNVYDFSEELSPAASAALPQAVNAVFELLNSM